MKELACSLMVNLGIAFGCIFISVFTVVMCFTGDSGYIWVLVGLIGWLNFVICVVCADAFLMTRELVRRESRK